MADWYPGAWRVDMGGNGNAITARPAENILHIAASSWNVVEDDPHTTEREELSRVRGIAGWNGDAKACNGYNDQYGNFQQYCSVWSAVSGTKDGNWRNRTWESWNPEGLFGSNAQYNSSTWTAQQCERWSDLLAWDHNENGSLLQDMQNSLRSSHGVGVHRYGVNDAGPKSRVPGGESWTAHDGKPCPGTARVYQLAGIIARAQVIAAAVRAGRCGYLPQGRVNLAAALARTGGVAHTGVDTPTTTTPKDDSLSAADVAELKKYIDAKFDAYSQVNGESYPVTSMLAYIDFNVNRAVDAATAAANKVGATVPARKAVARKPKPAPKPAPPVVKPPAPPAKPTSHTVQQGETLSTIAGKYGTTWQALAQLNKLSNPDVVNPGDVLQLPK